MGEKKNMSESCTTKTKEWVCGNPITKVAAYLLTATFGLYILSVLPVNIPVVSTLGRHVNKLPLAFLGTTAAIVGAVDCASAKYKYDQKKTGIISESKLGQSIGKSWTQKSATPFTNTCKEVFEDIKKHPVSKQTAGLLGVVGAGYAGYKVNNVVGGYMDKIPFLGGGKTDANTALAPGAGA